MSASVGRTCMGEASIKTCRWCPGVTPCAPPTPVMPCMQLKSKKKLRDFPVGPVANTLLIQRLIHLRAGDPGSTPGQGTRSHMLQLNILHTTTKIDYHARG